MEELSFGVLTPNDGEATENYPVAFLKAGGDRLPGKLGGRVYREVGGGDTVMAAAPVRVDPQNPARWPSGRG